MGTFFCNRCLDVSEVWAKSMRPSWRYEILMVGTSVYSYGGQSWCSAVIFRKRSAFETQFCLRVVLFTFKHIWKNHGDSFSRSQERGIWISYIEVLFSAFFKIFWSTLTNERIILKLLDIFFKNEILEINGKSVIALCSCINDGATLMQQRCKRQTSPCWKILIQNF